jgi:hypothetical protein
MSSVSITITGANLVIKTVEEKGESGMPGLSQLNISGANSVDTQNKNESTDTAPPVVILNFNQLYINTFLWMDSIPESEKKEIRELVEARKYLRDYVKLPATSDESRVHIYKAINCMKDKLNKLFSPKNLRCYHKVVIEAEKIRAFVAVKLADYGITLISSDVDEFKIRPNSYYRDRIHDVQTVIKEKCGSEFCLIAE